MVINGYGGVVMKNIRSFFAKIAVVAIAIFVVSGCGGGGGGSSSGGGGDYYYHFICNGDSQCLQLNFMPTGTPSGTSNQGPGAGGQSGCNSLMTFGRKNWNIPPAQQWCDNSPTLTPPPATLISIAVTPANKTLALGLTQQYTATGNYSNGTSRNITTQVTWSANCGGVLCTPAPAASISASGLATTSTTGTITIVATLGSISGRTTLYVTAASLLSITVTPANPTVNQYSTQQFTATGHYSDGTSAVLSSVTWSSATPATATINSTGLATAVVAGTSTITATMGSITGSTLMTVSAVTLQSIAVIPTNPSLAKGFTRQLTATGTYSDATVRDITSQVAWSSVDSTVASISSSGLVTGLTLGSSLMSATLAGLTGSTTVTVTAAVLQSIAVTPASPSVETGLTKQLIATGTYSDSSTQDITTQATWTSATLANATVNSSGLVTGVAAGTSLIGANLNGVFGSTTLTVITLGSSWAPVTSGVGGGSGTANALMGITWTGSQFVAVGVSGTIMTSPDGITWITQTSGTSANLNAIIWTGSQLVAVGASPYYMASSAIVTSPDGITWTSRNSGTTLALNALTWTGTKIVAVGVAQTTLSSPDGIAWTPIGTLGYGNDFSCIAWSGTIYVGCLGIATSSDLINWTFNSSQPPHGVIWTGTRFVLVSDSGVIYVLTSDGGTWNYPSSGTGAVLRAIAWSGSQFAAVGDTGTVITAPDTTAYLTTNGTQWTVRNSGSSSNLRGIAWSGAHLVAVGDAGTILFTSP